MHREWRLTLARDHSQFALEATCLESDFEAGAEGKSRRLRRIALSLLRFFGSVAALLYSLAFVVKNGDGCNCNWAFIQTFLGWPILAGSVIGFIGSGLYPAYRRTSGVLLLMAGALVTPLAFFVALGSWPDLGAFFLVGIFFAPSFLASFLLLLAGLLSFTKTRHLIKKWRDGGWIPGLECCMDDHYCQRATPLLREVSRSTKFLTFDIQSWLANGSPGEIRTPVDGSLPHSNGPKPVIGRARGPLLVRYTTGLQSSPDFD